MHAFMIALAISVSVANNHSVVHKPLDPPPGEAQSTIVAPGLKSQCRAGRFLVSNDSLRPPAAGLVTGRDLDHLGGPDTIAKFDDPPGMTAPRSLPQAYRDPNANPKLYPRYAFVTNDHDLVTLSNGDVLYLTGAASRAYVQVPWFSVAYRDQFGPGARSVLLTWRSQDCGETFHYMGELDPARIAGGSCAMPQFRVDADHKMRTPGSDDFFVAYAMTFPGNVYGMRVSFYDRKKNAFTSSTDIVPSVKSAESFIFHLTAIDNGSGPVLLYWNDVDGDKKIVTVRGHFVLRENMFSDDFVIAKPFPLIKTVLPGSWFGDYQTASGYRDHFYPMWIEPHGVIRFAEIDITEK